MKFYKNKENLLRKTDLNKDMFFNIIVPSYINRSYDSVFYSLTKNNLKKI